MSVGVHGARGQSITERADRHGHYGWWLVSSDQCTNCSSSNIECASREYGWSHASIYALAIKDINVEAYTLVVPVDQEGQEWQRMATPTPRAVERVNEQGSHRDRNTYIMSLNQRLARLSTDGDGLYSV